MKIKDPALFGKINVFFTEYLPVVRRESPNTITAYRYTINIYFEFLEDIRQIKLWEAALADFTQKNLLAFMDWLQAKRKNGISTVNLRLVHMRKFCRFLMEDNILHLAELAAIQRIAELPPDNAEEIRYLSVEETKLLLSQPKTNTKLGVRNSFFMHLLYDSGCRVQEMLDLKKESFVLGKEGAALHIIGKGNKFRAVPISAELVPMFKEYCGLFHSGTVPDEYLFYTERKGRRERMSCDNVQRFVEKYGAQARNSIPSIPHMRMKAMENQTRRKQYVKVIAAHLVDGTVEPQTIILDKGERFCVESVKEVKPITTLPPYEFANRYTVLIKGKETALYEENGRFFVKMKT